AQAAAVGVASGDVDYCVSSITGGLISLAEKDAIKVIGGALSADPEVDGALLLASTKALEAGLDHPSKIKGKSFGITTAGSSFHYMAHKIAQGNGFTLEDVTLRSLQKVGSVVGAITTGQVDAWAIQPSVGKKLVADGAA